MIDAVLRLSAEDDCHDNSKKKPDPPGREAHVWPVAEQSIVKPPAPMRG
jgi:hypothetical protein